MAGYFDDILSPVEPGKAAGTAAPGYFDDILRPKQADDGSNVVRGAKVALGQAMPLLKGTAGLIGATAENVLGEGGYSTQLKDWGLQGYQQGMAKLQPLQHENDSLTEAWNKAKDGDTGAMVEWASYGLGYSLGQLGEVAATSIIGGVVGGALGGPLGAAGGAAEGAVAKGTVKALARDLIENQVAKEAARIAQAQGVAAGVKLTEAQAVELAAGAAIRQAATKAVASRLGSNAGLGAYVFTQEAGSIYPEAENQAQEKGTKLDGGDLARVWGASLAAAGVEGLTERLKLDALAGRVHVPGPGGRVARGLIGGTVGAVGEAGTEAVQTGIERFGAGQSLTDAEAIKDYVDSAGLGAVGGLGAGGVAGAYHAPGAAATDKIKADQIAAEAAAKLAATQAAADRVLNAPTVADAIRAADEATMAAVRDATAAPLPPGAQFDAPAQRRVDLANEREATRAAVGPAIDSRGQTLIDDEQALKRNELQRQQMQVQAALQQAALQRRVNRSPGAADVEGPPVAPESLTRPATEGQQTLDRRAPLEQQARTALSAQDRQLAQQQLDAEVGGQRGVSVTDQYPAGMVPMTRLRAQQALAVLQREGGAPPVKIVRHPSEQTVLDDRGLKQPAFVLQAQLPMKRAAPPPAPSTLTTPEQQALAEKSVVGTFGATLKTGSAQLKAAGDLILKRVTERGGVASPVEADLLLRAGLGKPYDRIDPALDGQANLATDMRPRDDKGDVSGPAPVTPLTTGAIVGDPGLTGATGIALDQTKRVREHLTPEGTWQDRRDKLAAPAPEVAPGALPDTSPFVTGMRRAGAAMPARPEPPVITPTAPEAPPTAPEAPPPTTAPATPSELRGKLQLNTHNPALEVAVKAAVKSGKPSAIKAIWKELAKSTNPVIAYLGEHLGKAINPAYKVVPWRGGRGDYGSHLRVSMGAELKLQPRNVAKRHEGFEDDEHVVAHELTHALTVNNYHHPRTPAQRQAKLELQELARQAKVALKGETDPDTRGHVGSPWYGTLGTNIDTLTKEFLAEAFTNPSFQARLAEIPYGDMSLWTKFVKALAKLLGLDKPSMLSEALRLGEALMDKKARADPVGRRTPEAPVWEDNTDHGQETTRDDRRPEGVAPHQGVPGAQGQAPDLTARQSTRAYGTKPAEPFYSDLARALQALSTKAAPTEGWKQAIKALVAKNAGIGDEVEWSGINEWLDMQQGKVPREALLAYLDANGVKVIETTLREPPPPPPTMRDKLKAARSRIEDRGYMVIEETIEGETPDTPDRGIFLNHDGTEPGPPWSGEFVPAPGEPADEDRLPADVARDLAFLREHINDPRETRGDLRGWTVQDRDRLDELENRGADRTEDEDIERQRLISRENAATPDGASEPKLPKHGDPRWQLPGGKSYREVLLILVPKVVPPNKLDDAKITAQGINPTSGRPYVQFNWHGQKYAVEHLASESAEDAMLQRINAPTSRGSGEVRPIPGERLPGQPAFNQSHWEEDDVLAHIRLNDRYDAGGNRVLFVEEIQSDWAQKGKKDGFGLNPRYTVRDANGNVRGDFASRDLAQAYLDNPPEHMRHLFDHTARVVEHGEATLARLAQAENEADDIREAAKSLLLKYKGDLAEATATHRRAVEEARTADEVEAAIQWLARARLRVQEQDAVNNQANRDVIAASRARNEYAQSVKGGVPNAPFVTKTDAWVALAIKRVLKMAVDEGYDKVAFVNGQQSADRYSLTQAVDQLMYARHEDGRYTLGIKRIGSSPNDAFQTEVGARSLRLLKAADLPEYVGEELAEKIIAGEGTPRGTSDNPPRILSGIDLRVGGEGMKAFYDSIVPKVAARISKKLGGEALETTHFPGSIDYQRAAPAFKAAGISLDSSSQGMNPDTYSMRQWGTQERVRPEALPPDLRSLWNRLQGYTRPQYGAARPPASQPGITITPKMREMAAGGVPLFARQNEARYSPNSWAGFATQAEYEARQAQDAEHSRRMGTAMRRIAMAPGPRPTSSPEPRVLDRPKGIDPNGWAGFATQAEYEAHLKRTGRGAMEPGAEYSADHGLATDRQDRPGDGSGVVGARTAATDGVRGDAPGAAVPVQPAAPNRRRTTGLAIAERIERTGHEALDGAVVRTPLELAELAQVFRDPRYETFRVFFIRGNTIVHSTAMSSRTVDAAGMVPAGVSEAEYYARMQAMMRSTGADGYYMLHNHPSGDPSASQADRDITSRLAAAVPGLRAHVIVNSNRYAVIEQLPGAGGELALHDEMHVYYFGPEKLLQASKPLAVLGRSITKSDDLAMLGKAVQRPGYITLVGTDASGKVRVVTEVPADVLQREDRYLMALVRRVKRMSGSSAISAVGSNADMASRAITTAVSVGILRDAVPEVGRPLRDSITPQAPPASIESPTREAKGPDVLADNYKGLEGKKVDYPVHVADTGQTGSIRLDAATALRDYDDRLGALRRLVECLA